MQRRQITLEDGRYLIFYTFEEETTAPPDAGAQEAGAAASSERRAAEPDVEPQATEERRV